MQNSSSKFHNFLFQSSKFAFCYFSPLSFNPSQFSLPLIFRPSLPFITLFYFFLILEKNVIFISIFKRKQIRGTQ